MLNRDCIRELQSSWLPHLTDSALDRLIELLDRDSPLLIYGCFSRAVPTGCLATHAAWHHPKTCHLLVDAGITWLHQVAGLNPATSYVLRVWDTQGPYNWRFRAEIAAQLKAERRARRRMLGTSTTRKLVQA